MIKMSAGLVTVAAILAGPGKGMAQGQPRLLVLPPEVSTPADSAVSLEMAAVIQEQLRAALLGETHVIWKRQMDSAFRRSGAGILRRRHQRGHNYRALEGFSNARHRAEFDLCLQRKGSRIYVVSPPT